ncbi:Ras-specific guanine nucleotide-releasing factor RalGPS2, partial [Schistosoma japonicum]
MDFCTPDRKVSNHNLRSYVKNTSNKLPGYIPPLIRGLSLEDSMKCTPFSTPKHRSHPSRVRVNHGFTDASSLDSIFSQPTVSNQKGITNISNDKSNRSKSSTVPNVIRIARKSYDTLDVGTNRYEKHLKADAELIAQQITLIELEYFQAIEADEFYTLKWNSKEKLQYAPNIVASTRWFNQIIFWVQKDILNEKNMSKRTEILSHFIRIAKKLVDINNFSSAMAVVSALNVQCIYRLSATWSNLCSRDRHTFRKLADLFSQEQNYLNLRSAVDNARLPCIPYLGIFLCDLTYIDVAASSIAMSTHHREHSTWDTQGKQDRINNILRIIAKFQQSNYSFVRNEFIASYLEAQRYIEELQRFIEDANYKLSIQLEPLPPPPDPSFSTVPPNYSFLNNNNTNNNNGNNYVLKPVPIHNCSANVSSNCDTTTTSLSSVKTTSSLSPLSCKTPTVNSNNNISVKHTNKDIADHSSPNSTPNQRKKQSKSISPLCDLIAPPAIPPPPSHVKRTHFQEDMSIQLGHHHLNTEFFAGNSVQRPRKRPTHRRLGSWAGVGLLSCDNYLAPSVEKCVHHAKQIVDK